MAASLAARTLARPSFEEAFAAPAFLRAMLAFEAALAEAQAAEGVIPAPSAAAIATACARLEIDVEALVREAKRSATLAVPLVNALSAEVARVDRVRRGVEQARPDVERIVVIGDANLRPLAGGRALIGILLREVRDRLAARPHGLVEHAVDQTGAVR